MLLVIKTSVIQQASGSCYIETQNIKIICSIYGPKQSTSSLNKPITCEYTSAPFSKTKHASLQKSQSDKEIALIIESCFEGCLIMGPKMGVDVFVMVLEEDGRMATIGNAVTSISLGLMDAGVEMKDSIIGVSCGFHDDKIIMDCTQVDEEIPFVDPLNSTLDKMDAIECKKVCLNGGMFLAYMPNMNQVSFERISINNSLTNNRSLI